MIVRINHRQSHLIAKLNTDYTHSLINKIGQNRTQAKRRESKNQNRRTERVVNQHKQGAAEHKSKGSRYKINPFRNLEPRLVPRFYFMMMNNIHAISFVFIHIPT